MKKLQRLREDCCFIENFHLIFEIDYKIKLKHLKHILFYFKHNILDTQINVPNSEF